MICDRLENAPAYYHLGSRFERGLRYLAENDLSGLEPGEYPIDGRDVLLKIQHYDTMPPEQCKIELHEVYADIQYIIEGVEGFGYTHREFSIPRVPYDPAIDMALVDCPEIGFILQKPGCFAIAFPQDAHQSCRIAGTAPCRVKKALIKVRL